MKIIGDGNELETLLIELLARHDKLRFAVAWAGKGTAFLEEVIKNGEKLSKGIIGTHFHQTHPDILHEFAGNPKVRFNMDASGGVFHPKIYLFGTKKDWDLIIGSANMTRAAFNGNSEACVHISSYDDTQGNLYGEIIGILKGYWKCAEVMTEDLSCKYRHNYELNRPRTSKASGSYAYQGNFRPPSKIRIMSWNWEEYLEAVMNDKHHSAETRCAILERARELFARKRHLAGMLLNERLGIGGINQQDKGLPWFWFGQMNRTPMGAKLKAESEEDKDSLRRISSALDLVPLSGRVMRESYMAFIREVHAAFPNGGHGLGSVTRLLAMKRPDVFVCLDNKNLDQICREFGIDGLGRDKMQSFWNYWDAIIMRIVDSAWWRSPQPAGGLAAEIWKGRSAMLDAIFYDPDA